MRDNDLPDEANRYDGAPAPERNAGLSPGDVKAAAEEARRNAACEHCGSGDYNNLKKVPRKYTPNCSALRMPPGEPILLCPDCAEEHTPEEEHIEALREADEVKVLYECGASESAEPAENSPDAREGHHSVETRGTIHVECRCGAEIDEILY